MPFRYAIDPKRHFCYIRLEGYVDEAYMLDAIVQVYSDPDMHRDFDNLWDCTRISELVLDLDAFEAIRKTLNQQRPEASGKGAVYAPRDVVFLAAQYLKAVLRTERREVEVFRDLTPAMAWLGATHLPDAASDEST